MPDLFLFFIVCMYVFILKKKMFKIQIKRNVHSCSLLQFILNLVLFLKLYIYVHFVEEKAVFVLIYLTTAA